MFPIRFGLIPACDVSSLSKLQMLIEATSSLPFIAGYKIGTPLSIPHGLKSVSEVIRRYSDLPIIYDHQKYGSDIPAICARASLQAIIKSRIDGLIIFPHAGIETLQRTVNACFKAAITPIIGGDMTHKGYLARDGGYIADDAPTRIYQDAAKLGVDHYVIPGTKPQMIPKYRGVIEASIEDPIFLFPGVGKGQGGDIRVIFDTLQPHSAFAIVGRGIYSEADPTKAAINLWQPIQRFIKRNNI